MTAKLLLIDDDVLWCKALQIMLTKRDFQIEVAHDAIEGLRKAYAFNPDAILLDLMLPGMDGWQVCRRFREMSNIPIIMLTALDSDAQMIEGLDLGADDYISKTVPAGELAARIQAVLRRTAPANQYRKQFSQESVISYEHLVIDFDKYEVTVAGERIDLSPTEFKLLAVFLKYQGRVLPHDFLVKEVWGPNHVGDTTSLRLYIGYLRRKIDLDPDQSLIQSEWGIGYRFG